MCVTQRRSVQQISDSHMQPEILPTPDQWTEPYLRHWKSTPPSFRGQMQFRSLSPSTHHQSGILPIRLPGNQLQKFSWSGMAINYLDFTMKLQWEKHHGHYGRVSGTVPVQSGTLTLAIFKNEIFNLVNLNSINQPSEIRM